MSESNRDARKKAAIPGAAALTTAAAMLGFASGAVAQTGPTDLSPEAAEAVDEVVVTGFRASLDKALEAKQAQVGAIDMIVAEDIADFPDLNLAESLQRVPGVVITRDAGEGRQISVRGLGPQFTRVRINGIEAMSANGSTDASGGTNRLRSFDFNTFASELFNNITVRKTASADTEEGSLGATVDLRTGRPFDYDGLTIAGGLQLGYNDLNEDVDPRGTFSVSNTFADGRLGALLSLAYTYRKLADEGASTVRWQGGGGFAGLDANYTGTPTIEEIQASFRPRIPRYDKYEHEQSRLGVTASLQFAPSDATAINLDLLYAKFDAERDEIFLEAPVFSTGGANGIGGVTVIDAEIDENNSLVYGVFNGVDIRSESRHDELTTEFQQATLELKHRFSEKISLNGVAGFAEADHDNPVQTTLLFDAANIAGYSYDFRENSRLPLITYGVNGDALVTNPATWSLSQIRLRPQGTTNTFKSAAFDIEFAATDAWTFKAGPSWKNYQYESTELRRSNGTLTNQETNVAGMGSVPITDYSRIVTFGDGLDLPAGTVTRWLIPDINSAIDALSLNDRSIFPLGIEPVLVNNNSVEEDDLGAFVQADFRYELGSHALRGNIGVRYVQTDQTSRGYTFVGGQPVQAVAKRDYSDVLPSLNLVFDVSDKLLLRAGASKVMTRANLNQLAPGAAVSVSGNNRTVTVGNPSLDPFRAKSYDLGVEWYFADQALLSAAVFYKDVDSFVQTRRDQRAFTDNPYGLPDSIATAACGTTAGCSASELWDFTVPINTPGGDLRGFEISYQQPFSFLPGAWSNFGVILNYTGVESEITYETVPAPPAPPVVTFVDDDLTGLSKSAYNATLYFDNKVISARVSAAYRSDYLTTIPGRNGNDVEGTAETLNIDFTASYNINQHFTVSLEGLNLTDEAQDQWVSSTGNRLSYYHHQGRQFYFGGRFKF
jgi:TonB-dependent receptor